MFRTRFLISLNNGKISNSICGRNICSTKICLEDNTKNVFKSSLFDLHTEMGGKMVPYGGYLMPLIYSSHSITESNIHTRTNASIFDVSHMLQTNIYGKDRIEFMESLSVADIRGLKADSASLSLFTNQDGGIQDDFIVSNCSDKYLYIVSNATRTIEDKKLLHDMLEEFKNRGKDVKVEHLNSYKSLIALQGPASESVLQNLLKIDLKSFYFMSTTTTKVAGISNCRVTRCGYTGEDGFELSVDSKDAVKLVTEILDQPGSNVKLAGLGARDSLRLEAGLCLYGNDMDETTTPAEAGLVWTIGKRRREMGDFPGAEIILKQLKEKTFTKKRVGFVGVSGGAPGRSGALILDLASKKKIGIVSSGAPSPSLKKNIAMGYIQADKTKIGNRLSFRIRNKEYEYEIVKMPFVPSKYYLKKK